MLIDLVLGLFAGATAPHTEPRLKKALEGVMLAEMPITPGEMRLLAFAVSLVGALGVFAPSFIDRYRGSRSPHE